MNPKYFRTIRRVAGLVALSGLGSLFPLAGQTARPAYKPPRTADGQPDIQGIYARAGIWDNSPQQFEMNGPVGAENPIDGVGYSRADGPPEGIRPRLEVTPDDIKPQGENSRYVVLAGPPPVGQGPSKIWRTGLIEPPNKILPWKPAEDKKRREFLLRMSPVASLRHVEYDARCSLPGLFHNGGPYQFIQPKGEVVILSEYQHYTRTIHLDGRPHIGSSIRLFMGDSIGKWEGNVLTVDTTNFNEFTGFTRAIPYLSDALHTTEVYTVLDENNIGYVVTIDDPKLFTAPWKTAGLFRKGKAGFELVEYGCSEGTETLKMIFGAPSER